MKRFAILFAALALSLLLLDQSAQAAARVWGNAGTDYNTSANWNATAGPAPGAGDVGQFTAAPGTQPNISASLSNAGVYFSGAATTGFNLTATAGAVLTVTGVGATGSGGTSNSSAAAIRSEATSGTNTVSAPINLGAAAAATQVFFQQAGGTLIVSGVVSRYKCSDLEFQGNRHN